MQLGVGVVHEDLVLEARVEVELEIGEVRVVAELGFLDTRHRVLGEHALDK
jgi:hypothetical protein